MKILKPSWNVVYINYMFTYMNDYKIVFVFSLKKTSAISAQKNDVIVIQKSADRSSRVST